MRVKTLCILIIGFLTFSMRAERTDVSNKVLNTGDWEVGFTFILIQLLEVSLMKGLRFADTMGIPRR